ncbi:MAG: MoaD/ThiS family protein [Planctomycetaceae bacterium]|nr:MoaD/ThiS family protein [Planctomycetaceae bacterium]
MNVAVRLFARARKLAGTDSLVLTLTEPASVRQLKERLGETCPALRPLLPQLLVAVGTDYVTDDMLVAANSDIACFPPVSGG